MPVVTTFSWAVRAISYTDGMYGSYVPYRQIIREEGIRTKYEAQERENCDNHRSIIYTNDISTIYIN